MHTDGKVSSLKLCAGADIDTKTWRDVECPPVPTTYQRFAEAVASGKNGDPNFRRAADIQRVLDADPRGTASGARLKVAEANDQR